MTSKNLLLSFGSGKIQSTWCGHAWFRQEERAQRLPFWVRTPPSGVGSSMRGGEGRKVRSLPRKLGCFFPKPRVKQTLCPGCPGNSAGMSRIPGIVQKSKTLEPLRNTANGIFQRENLWSSHPGHLQEPCGLRSKTQIPQPHEWKKYRRILWRSFCVAVKVFPKKRQVFQRPCHGVLLPS